MATVGSEGGMSKPLDKAHQAALEFIRLCGPHTMGPIQSDEEMCAAMTFIQLREMGLTKSTNLGSGYVQWSLADRSVH